MHAERGVICDHGWANIKELSCAFPSCGVVRQPLVSVCCAEFGDEEKQLLRVECWKRDSCGGDEHAVDVPIRSEEAEFAIETAVEFHAFEALGGVV